MRTVNPCDYLRDILTRLPAMKLRDVGTITPASWAAARKAA